MPSNLTTPLQGTSSASLPLPATKKVMKNNETQTDEENLAITMKYPEEITTNPMKSQREQLKSASFEKKLSSKQSPILSMQTKDNSLDKFLVFLEEILQKNKVEKNIVQKILSTANSSLGARYPGKIGKKNDK